MVREALGWPAGPPSDARARSAYPVLPNYFAEEHEGSTPEQVGVNLVPPSAAEYARQRLEQLAEVNGVAEPDRLWRNLLSSQPLAFSIAGHLRDHQAGAAELFGRLTGLEVVGLSRLEDGNAPKHTLDGIDAEWFPPRQHHTNDRSGFDIAALLELAGGTHTLLTIEVKYIDSFSPGQARSEQRGVCQRAERLRDQGGRNAGVDGRWRVTISPLCPAHGLGPPERHSGRDDTTNQ